MAEKRMKLLEEAKQNILVAQIKQKRDHDRRHAKPHLFNTGLYTSHKECIAGGNWLTDDIITAVEKLMKIAYPHTGGLQPPILGETLGYAIEKGEFVQVLNVRHCHWITVSTIGCPKGQVNVFDSLP